MVLCGPADCLVPYVDPGRELAVRVRVAVAEYTAAKATLTFRLYETTAANFRSETAFDNLQTSGLTVTDGGFEQQGTWTMDSTYGNLIPSVDVFDPQLPAHVFQAVGDVFSGSS